MRGLDILVGAAFAASLVGCASSGDGPLSAGSRSVAKSPGVHRLERLELKTDGLDVEAVDMNDDGRADQTTYSRNGRPVYIRRDFNVDGVPDVIEFYDSEGVRVRDEMDFDYDGICDLIIHYKNGRMVSKEYAVDFEGNRYGVQYFDENGNCTEIHRDVNGDGQIDRVEYYKPGEDAPYKTEHSGKLF